MHWNSAEHLYIAEHAHVSDVVGAAIRRTRWRTARIAHHYERVENACCYLVRIPVVEDGIV
jgi:hypothetical protein